MLDTVKLCIPFDECKVNSPEIFIPSIRNSIKKSVKYVCNPDNDWLKNGKYFPKLAIYKDYNNENQLIIEFSAPKLVFGNNFEELQTVDFSMVIEELLDRLSGLDIQLSANAIENAKVFSIHYSKNFELENISSNQIINTIDCEQKGLEVIKEFVIVESSTRGEREKFYEVINFIKKQKETINLVCDKVDRLQRSFKEMPIIDELRRSGKLILHFFVEGQILDANSNSSQIMAYQMYIMMAESYTNSISDNVKRSFEKMRQEDKITGTAPIGYLNKNDGRGKTDIILDPDRAFLVKRIFEEYSTGLYSLKEIRKKTIEWNLKNKTKSNTYLSVSQIDKLLKNKFYYGVATYKGQDYKHIYPHIIDKDLFDKCDDVRNGRHRNRSNTTNRFYIQRYD